ncbi:hypothetical protein P0Y35_18805 [Kiritimatiellaeota bacterium B1221]|nr:hypothetical protein [Kiritimatiellaeota bacterium B1221]
MNSKSPEWLSDAIKLLPSDTPVPEGTQGYACYTTQKAHWLGWLDPDRIPVKYARATGKEKDAKYAYNHIMEPKMLLWLAAASGIPSDLCERAENEAAEKKSFASKSAAVRRLIPWAMVEDALSKITKGQV